MASATHSEQTTNQGRTTRPLTEAAGLSTAEAQARLKQVGPNSVAEERPHPLRRFLKRFWAPIPWLLEASIVLQLFLGEHIEAAIIFLLLLLNAVLGFVQEGRAQKALVLLRQQLRVDARVRRDGRWITLPAEELVPDDVVHLRQGSAVAADVRIFEGELLADQSALTGESAAVLVGAGGTAYAGAMVRGGEATGRVTATGARTFFGKTAELVRTAEPSHRQEQEITAAARDLFVFNVALVLVVLGFAHTRGMTLEQILPLAMTILLASIPVALPATFTLAAALGSLELSRRGVLVTRLSALHDVAAMTVLCSDKTGTLTRNEATLAVLSPTGAFSEDDLLRTAALASDPSGQDPVDAALVGAAERRGLFATVGERLDFKPFDPAKKRAEASYRETGGVCRYFKGAPAVIAGLCGVPETLWEAAAREIAARGQRVLAAAVQRDGEPRFAGLLGLEDAVREESAKVVRDLEEAGVRVVMVTGDNALTAQAVADRVGISADICPAEALRSHLDKQALTHRIFANVFPEDKFRLVRAFQREGEIVGMSGDGVNDAPALRQAEAGVAVANATDVAKAAAAIVLTQPGLGDVIPAIEIGRKVFQRVITYTLNMLTKKIEIMALLVIGFLLTRHKPLTPLMMVLIIFLNDFLTMAIATDRMGVSHQPNRWNTRGIVLTATVLAVCKLAFSLGIFLFGRYRLGLDTRHLQTLTFATLILSMQAGVYLWRERGHFWESRPSLSLAGSSVFALGGAAALTLRGILMPAISGRLFLGVAAATVCYFVALDWPKVWLFGRLRIR